jgi:hypothetical protein
MRRIPREREYTRVNLKGIARELKEIAREIEILREKIPREREYMQKNCMRI